MAEREQPPVQFVIADIVSVIIVKSRCVAVTPS